MGYSGGLACIPTLPLARRVNASADDLNPQGVPVNNTAWWQIEIVQVRVGTQEFPSAQGIVDTGTSTLIIPRAVNQFLDKLSSNTTCSNAGDLPPIVLTLAGGHAVSIGPEQYILGDGTGNCESLAGTLADAPSDDFFVLGDPFFWKYFVAFDFTRKQIGIGLKA